MAVDIVVGMDSRWQSVAVGVVGVLPVSDDGGRDYGSGKLMEELHDSSIRRDYMTREWIVDQGLEVMARVPQVKESMYLFVGWVEGVGKSEVALV